MVAQARVILKGAKTYNLGGKRFIQDVPVVVTGESEVAEFKRNGYFVVVDLKPKKAEAKAKVEEDEEDEDSDEGKSGKSKKGLLKKK